MNHVRMEGFNNFICRTFQVFRCRLDEGMDQAGSGVASLSSLEKGIDEAKGSNLEVVVVQAVYAVEAAILDEPKAFEP
ncbi:hypothetical protein Tco_0343680 [Tanacetum coccineum]